MIRRTLMCVAAIGCALSLAACQTATPSLTAAIVKIDPKAPAQISKLQAATVKGCKYEPTAVFAANVLGTVVAQATPFTDVFAVGAKAICDAATTGADVTTSAVTAQADGPVEAYAQASSGTGTVNGQPVKGRFVGKKKSG